MKQFFKAVLSILTFVSCDAQTNKMEFTYEHFEEQIIIYEPKQDGLSDKEYNYGLLLLKETKAAIKNDPSNLNDADFWNITMAFLNLKASKKAIEIAFTKAINYDNNNICSYIDAMGPSRLDEIIPELFYEFYKNCNQLKTVNPSIDLKKYSTTYNLNYELVLLIDEVNKEDRRYRKEKGKYYESPIKLEKQRKLDSKNEHIIDSLYKEHKTYLGNSLVGKEFSFVMWSVIQHSNIEMMERYLPVLNKAVKKNELDLILFKMLIDRFYLLKYDYQIFGSQIGSGTKIAEEKERKEIELKYRIE